MRTWSGRAPSSSSSPAARAVPELAGAVLSGRYRLDTQLGKGSVGAVFLGRDLMLDLQVAIKVLLREDPALLVGGADALRAEAVAAMPLAHPNIARVYTYDRDGELEFLVMEYVEGVPLSRYYRTQPGRCLHPAEAIRVALELLDGLEVVHDAGLVHNDIKPANVLMTPGGGVKLLDFGLARRAGARVEQGEHILGTAAYMSPERFRGEVVEPCSDLYSVGALLYTLSSGAPPFGARVAEAAEGHIRRPIPPAPHLPRLLHSVLACAMAKSPSGRFRSARAMSRALLSALEAAGGQPGSGSPLRVRVIPSSPELDYELAPTERVEVSVR